jgi:hypothetical protein
MLFDCRHCLTCIPFCLKHVDDTLRMSVYGGYILGRSVRSVYGYGWAHKTSFHIYSSYYSTN